MCCCMAVDQPTPNISVPDPATNIARTSGHVDGDSPSMTIGTAMAAMAIMPTRKGCRTDSRSMSTVATTVPSASALRASPQPSAPRAGARLDTSGPSTPSAPKWMALSNPKTTTTTHSHVREANSDQPSRSSAHIDVRSGADTGSRAGSFTRQRQRIAMRYVAASKARAHPGPTVTTSSPATAGPTTVSPLRENASSALVPRAPP